MKTLANFWTDQQRSMTRPSVAVQRVVEGDKAVILETMTVIRLWMIAPKINFLLRSSPAKPRRLVRRNGIKATRKLLSVSKITYESRMIVLANFHLPTLHYRENVEMLLSQ